MQWVVKASKLCNLRCSYCYEWDHLADPARMPMSIWREALVAMRDYAELATRTVDWPVPTDIIWHGGEPLLLPLSYMQAVLDLQAEIVPRDWIAEGRLTNCVQTNLFTIRDEQIAFLKEKTFNVGVSFDFVPGVRVTAGGRKTEQRVLENLDRLDEAGLPFALIVVLARHTASNIEAVFDRLAAMGRPARLLGLFSGPQSRPMDGVDITRPDMLAALFRAFQRWFEAGMTPKIDPFDECVKTVVMKRMNLQRPRHDRALLGSEVLQVDLDGRLTCTSFGYDRPIGNLREERIGALLAGHRYLDLIRDEQRLKDEVCTQCSFLGACDTKPIARWFDRATLADCPIERYLCPMIEDYFVRQNLFDDDFDTSKDAAVRRYAMAAMP